MMKTFPKLLFVLACACVLVAAQTEKPQPRQRTVAVTFDDLPYVNPWQGDYLTGAKRTTTELMRVLNAHHAPAIGFVNEGKLFITNGMDASVALLQQWLDAKMTLGNHTYSHADFNAMTVEQFQDEIVKGEVITRRLTEFQTGPRYFRHPMTRTGDTKEKKEAIEKFLASRGYKVTPHTIENSDFIFNRGYARAKFEKDEALAKKLREAYLEFTFAATDFAEKITPQIFGRDIPQVLLLHANELNADCLDEMLRRYEARGYRFITLDEAMNDPAYRTADTHVNPRGPTWLWRWSQSLKQNISFKDDPDPPKWVMERYNQR